MTESEAPHVESPGARVPAKPRQGASSAPRFAWISGSSLRYDGMVPQRVPHPHDKHLLRGWETCRRGISEVRSDSKKKDLVLQWIDEKLPRLNSPFLRRWRAILTGGEPGLVEELRSTESFFDLPEKRQDEWGQLVQSHPFAPLFARAPASVSAALTKLTQLSEELGGYSELK